MPNLITCLSRTFIFEWLVVTCESKNGHQKDVFKRDWTVCSYSI